jgi:hypothetical protein
VCSETFQLLRRRAPAQLRGNIADNKFYLWIDVIFYLV